MDRADARRLAAQALKKGAGYNKGRSVPFNGPADRNIVPSPYLAEVFADPHVRSRGMVQAWQHPLSGKLDLVASPLKLGGTPVRTDLPPPLLGEHTEQVLHEVLGWDDARIAALRAKEVI